MGLLGRVRSQTSSEQEESLAAESSSCGRREQSDINHICLLLT